MSGSIYGAPAGFSTAPISVQRTIRISSDLVRMYSSQNTDVRPGGLSLVPYGGATGTAGCLDITGADEATIAALGPGAVTRDVAGCAERTRVDRENMNRVYRINPCNFTYRLPFPIHNVQQMNILSCDVSNSYNISPALNNNYLTYYRPPATGLPALNTKTAVVVELPKGNYTSITDVLTMINTGLAMGTQDMPFHPQFRSDTLSGRVYFVDNEGIVDDATDTDGIHGILDFRHPCVTGASPGSMPRGVAPPEDHHSLGWLLGYRKAVYTGGANNGALPDMYQRLFNYPNYHGDWPGGIIDGAFVPTTTVDPNIAENPEFTPWGYIAEANFDLNNDNIFIAIEDNVSNAVGGYIYSNDGVEANGLNTIMARSPIGGNLDDFTSTARNYVQPYPSISRLQIRIFDAKGRQPDLGLNTLVLDVQFISIISAAAPLPKASVIH